MDSMSEADDICVLDTGSTDDTAEKLRARGAHVEQKLISPWRFDIARNESLKLIPKDADICCCIDLDEQFRSGWCEKLERACHFLRRGAHFIAANPDWVCPTAYGFVPDCGSVCEMLWRATSRRPIVIGKPEPLMPQLAMLEAGVSARETLLVGDRVYTDIASGANAGIDTLLVLSGETKEEDLPTADPQPTFVLPDVAALLNILES